VKPHQLLIVGQTPPPYHGQAVAIRQLLDAGWPDFDLVYVRMAYSRSESTIGKFSLRKVWHLAALVVKSIARLGHRRDAILYYPPAGPSLVPILRDVAFLAMVRPFARTVVLHFHAGGTSAYVQRRAWLRPAARLAYRGAAVAIQLGRSAPDDGAYFGAKRVMCVPNGLDVPLHARDPALGHGAVRILFVGHHTERKGIRLVLRTAAILHGKNLPFQVHTVGAWLSRRERRECEAMVRNLGLHDRVAFLGQLTGADKWREYANADVFFFPTYYEREGMPLVLLEAMAYTLPVVASRWRSIPDVVVDGVTGILCTPREPEPFAEALLRLCSDEPRRTEMGRAGRQRYEQCYTREKHLERMHAVFKTVAGSRGAPGPEQAPTH